MPILPARFAAIIMAFVRLFVQHRSTQRKVPRGRDDEGALTADLVALAEKYGR